MRRLLNNVFFSERKCINYTKIKWNTFYHYTQPHETFFGGGLGRWVNWKFWWRNDNVWRLCPTLCRIDIVDTLDCFQGTSVNYDKYLQAIFDPLPMPMHLYGFVLPNKGSVKLPPPPRPFFDIIFGRPLIKCLASWKNSFSTSLFKVFVRIRQHKAENRNKSQSKTSNVPGQS